MSGRRGSRCRRRSPGPCRCRPGSRAGPAPATLRLARAEPVGEPSQPAAPNSTPTTITVVAMLVISEVAIDQVASAAGLTLSLVTSWSTTIPPGHLAGDDHRKAGGDQSDPAEQHRHPALVARQVDRRAEGGEGEDREQQRQALDRDRDVLGGLQLVGLEDRDLAGVRWQLFRQLFADPDLAGEVGDQAAEVQRHVPFAVETASFLFFQHGDELFVGGPVGVFPEALGGRASAAPVRRRRRPPAAGRRRAARRTAWFRRAGCLSSSCSTSTFS